MLTIRYVVFSYLFFFNDTATTEIYTVRNTLSLHDALPICDRGDPLRLEPLRHDPPGHRSEEHTSELQSLRTISYAVFCLKKKKKLHHNIYFYSLNLHYSVNKKKIIN